MNLLQRINKLFKLTTILTLGLILALLLMQIPGQISKANNITSELQDLDLTLKDKLTHNPIPGAKFDLYEIVNGQESSNPVRTGLTTGTKGKVRGYNLPKGEYKFKQTFFPKLNSGKDYEITSISVEASNLMPENNSVNPGVTIDPEWFTVTATMKNNETRVLAPYEYLVRF